MKFDLFNHADESHVTAMETVQQALSQFAVSVISSNDANVSANITSNSEISNVSQVFTALPRMGFAYSTMSEELLTAVHDLVSSAERMSGLSAAEVADVVHG